MLYCCPRFLLAEEVRLKACSLHSSMLLSLRSESKNVLTLTARRVRVLSYCSQQYFRGMSMFEADF